MTQPEVRRERLVDTPHLLDTESTGPLPETLHIDRVESLDQDHRCFTLDLDRGTKRRLASAARRRGNYHDRSGQELIGLDHDPVANTVLLVAETLWILNRNTSPRCT